jgi:signal transduction histidine kinase
MDGRRHGTPEVDVDPEVEAWRVGVDKRRFERVLVNLMENADHYGGGVTTIAVGPGPETGGGSESGGGSVSGPTNGPGAAERLVEVRVDDAGPGIDPAERTKVFERFYRGSASGRRGTGTGTGLGLALVAEHMAVMHGAVRVESSPDGGARFVLSLPVLANGDEEEGEGDEMDELVGDPGATP